MKMLITLAVLTAIACSVVAQTSESIFVSETPQVLPGGGGERLITYFFNVQAGTLVGCDDCGHGLNSTFLVATTQGITIGKKLRAGVGVGYDSYSYWKTVPVFGMVSWDLIGNKYSNALFLQTAFGWANPQFPKDGVSATYPSGSSAEIRGGQMINPQIGYRIKHNNFTWAMSLGYKIQQLTYHEGLCTSCGPATSAGPPVITSGDVPISLKSVQIVLTAGWK